MLTLNQKVFVHFSLWDSGLHGSECRMMCAGGRGGGGGLGREEPDTFPKHGLQSRAVKNMGHKIDKDIR